MNGKSKSASRKVFLLRLWFTAQATTGGDTPYDTGDIIRFNEVRANFGGHYNPATSSFICPVDGVYLLSLNVQGAYSDQIHPDLMRDSTWLAKIWIDDISGASNRGSTTIVTECSRGEALWVRAGSTGRIHATDRTVFTGHLIHRF